MTAHTSGKPFTPEQHQQILDALADGQSHREIARTLGIDRDRIARAFPGTGWTLAQSGAYGRLVRTLNEATT